MPVERIARVDVGVRVAVRTDLDLLCMAHARRAIGPVQILGASSGPMGLRVFEIQLFGDDGERQIEELARLLDILESFVDWPQPTDACGAIEACLTESAGVRQRLLRAMLRVWRIELAGDLAQLGGRIGGWVFTDSAANDCHRDQLRTRVFLLRRIIRAGETALAGDLVRAAGMIDSMDLRMRTPADSLS